MRQLRKQSLMDDSIKGSSGARVAEFRNFGRMQTKIEMEKKEQIYEISLLLATIASRFYAYNYYGCG